jgi:hypothetical protein
VTETLGDVLRGKVIRHLSELFEEHLEGVRGILGLLFLASHGFLSSLVVYTSSRDRLMTSFEQKVWSIGRLLPKHDDAIKSCLDAMNEYEYVGFVTFPQQIRVAPRGVNMLPKSLAPEAIYSTDRRRCGGVAAGNIIHLHSIDQANCQGKAQIAASRGTCHTRYRS